VGDAISSALRQSYAAMEVIVVDDGSTDSSPDIIGSFGERVRCVSGANQGANRARNRGLALARGEWIQFLDCDDVLHPRRLEVLLAAAREQRSSSYVWASHVRFEHPEIPEEFRQAGALPSVSPSTSRQPFQAAYAPWAAVFHRDFLASVGPWNESLVLWDDLEYHARIIRQTRSYVRVPVPLYAYRQHEAPRNSDARRDVPLTLRAVTLAREAVTCAHLDAGERDRWLFPFYVHLARIAASQGDAQLFRHCLTEAAYLSQRPAFHAKAAVAGAASHLLGIGRTSRILERMLAR
jgi:glycosyltransferase involved in cell wall biosynthesis